jgi:N-acetyl-gamma-glutamyl-phosphate reductase
MSLTTSKESSMADAQIFASGSPRILIAGASGFAGALAAELLWNHPGFELASITARSEVGKGLDEIQLHSRYRVPLVIEELDVDRLDGIDAAIVAYPHAAAAPTVGALRDRGIRVVDLSADFRLHDLATYEEWYGPHPRPDLVGEAVYGLTELHREEITTADLVANPGCFPTSALLALAPLARAGLIGDLVIDAKTAVTGAGRTPSETTHFSHAYDNVIPYGTGGAGHRHRPEIEAQLEQLGSHLHIQFQPHLVAMNQGKLSSCYVTPTRPIGQEELDALFHDAYDHEQFVEIDQRPPTPSDVRWTNFCRLFTKVDTHTHKVLVFSAIDNLWKGSSSQAVQNLNVMFGLNEASGLSKVAPQSGVLA